MAQTLKFDDQIHVRDLLVQAVIGVNDNERVKNQNMIINLTLWANFDAVAESDSINDTLNYRYGFHSQLITLHFK